MAYGKFCKRGHFWSFPASHSFISRGRRGTSWHSNIFADVSFCVGGALLLPHFQKMRCIFRGRRSFLKTSDVVLRGRRSTLDVSCCVFSANRIVSGARSGDGVQILWQWWHFVTGDENQRRPRTKHRFWGRFLRKFVGKRRFSGCEVWNVRKSRAICSFWWSNVSGLELLWLLWCRRGVYGGSCKTFPRGRFQNRLSCRFAWQA